MIFNKSKDLKVALNEFRVHVPKLDKNTEFELLIPDIDNAEYELRKICGSAVYDKAEKEYNDAVIDVDNTPLVLLVQGAIANTAFRDYTTTNDLRHSLTGRKASINPANEKQAWEFFIERDNAGLNFRIQKALNRLIDYLDREKVAEWTGSNVYQVRHRVLLSDFDIFSRYYPIENSLELFCQLLPFQLEMQRKFISPILGEDLLRSLIGLDLNASGSGGSDKLQLLFEYAAPALALWTMATGIKRLSVKLLPEGLVQQFKSSVQSRDSSFNVDGKEKDLIVSSLMKDAQEATAMLENQFRIITAKENNAVVAPVSMLADRNLAANKYFSI